MKKVFFLLLNISLSLSVFSQQGKDGPANISTSNTVVNNINTALSVNAPAGATSISVASATSFSVGDLILIIQMQGALVPAYVYEFGNPNDALPNDTSSGKVTAYNGSGNNEFAEINSISGNVITLNCALNDSFGIRGKTQIIRVPRYTSLTLSGAGSITCNTWNGITGGVVVIEVQGNTTLGNGTSINASSKGFRGGSPLRATGYGSTSTGHNYGSNAANNGAHKGESIVGDTNMYKALGPLVGLNYVNMPLSICKANVANGGGGNSMNCGGGGGSNGGSVNLWNGMGNPDATYAAVWNLESTTPANGTVRPTSSSGGGRGGYAFSANSSATADPTVNGPNSNAIWGGDSRHNDGGWGGTPLDYSTGKIFLGGGGGAGDGNDGHASGGGNGGGIIYIISYGTVTGGGQIITDGGSPLATSNFGAGSNGDDGAGGGGGGGTVLIKSVGAISLTAAIPISAQGGKGGDNNFGGFSSSNCYGPGGGGGGGYVATTNAVTGTNVNAGANGLVTGAGNTSRIKTKFPPNGATSGGSGSIAPSVAPFYLTATNYTVCASSPASLSVTVTGTTPSSLSVVWYTVATGGTSVYSGNPYNLTAPATAGTYTYYAGTCPGTYRVPVILTVNPGTAPTLTINATSTTVCSGSPVVLTLSGTATSYTWDANAGNATTNTVSVSPTSNTTYTVTGATSGACAGTVTASININVTTPPTITITPSSYTLCSGSSATLTASSSTTSYTWSSNAGSVNTSTAVVSPTSNDTYTVTGGSGSCTSTQTVAINVTTTPTVGISPVNAYICNGSNTTFTASGATTYSWSTGVVTNTVSVSPTSNTTYTVTGYNGSCFGTKTVLVKVDGGITKADSVLFSASCGQANGSYVLNSITGGISPYQINFNGTGFTSIPAFSYTVSNIAGNVYPITFKDSLGCMYTTSVTIGNTSGITKIDSAISNANCSPANSGTITINSITGGASPYQININNGPFSPIGSLPYQFNNLTAGTYTIQVKDATNCPHTSYITVGSNGGVTSATYSLTPDTCNRGIGAITNITPTGGVAQYSFAINNGTYQAGNTFTGLASGTYTINIQDGNGCVYTAPVATITNTGVATTPTVTAGGATTFCQGGSIILTSSSAASYTWSTGATTQTITVNTGNTTYSVATTSANGCSTNSDTIRVTVNPNPNPPLVSDTTVNECQNNIQQIHFNSQGILLIHNSSGQIQSLPFAPTISGVYTAYDSLNKCISAVKNITVTISPTPTVAPLVLTPIQYCLGTPAIALTATATAANVAIVWQDANHNPISTPPNPTPLTTALGITTYYLYQSIGGCNGPVDSIQVIVVAKPNPNFTAYPAIDVSVGQAISFVPVQTSTTNAYYWNFEDPASVTDTSTKQLPSYIYNTAGTYCPKLIVTNSAGCKDSTSICIDVLANITMVIPNVFSPNSDGINDVFSVKANGFLSLTCDIFDRWGLKLYSFTGTGGYWDGAKAVDGTYFYVIQTTDVKGEDHKYNGFVQLIK